MTVIHPLVRDLYKRALVVGQDYPLGMEYVRRTWKKGLRNPDNCPSCYQKQQHFKQSQLKEREVTVALALAPSPACEKELRKAVGRGRYMIREMIGVIQLKKYRTLKRRYDTSATTTTPTDYHNLLMKNLDQQSKQT